MTEPPLLIPVDASPFHLRVRHLWTEMEEPRWWKEKEQSEGIGRNERQREREQGRILLSLLLLSSFVPLFFATLVGD